MNSGGPNSFHAQQDDGGVPNRRLLIIVIPAYNEAPSLLQLHQEIAATAHTNELCIEIIFVDDGSKDDSWKVIQGLSSQDSRVRGIRFRRNFGKAAALAAGFGEARGQLVLTMDADLQDDPREIPRFLEKIDAGADVVSGYKQVRHDPWHKVFPSRVFNALVSWMTGVKLHDHNCGMKCYRAECLAEVQLYGERHRFVPVLCAARGYTVDELVIHHRPRIHGSSKYGFQRMIKGFLDLLTIKFLTGFDQRPQHFLGVLGLAFFGVGMLVMILLAGEWCYLRFYLSQDPKFAGRPALLYSLGLVLLGGQLLSLGFIAELITAYHSRVYRPYSISARTPRSPDGVDAVNGVNCVNSGNAVDGANAADSNAPAPQSPS